MENFEFNLQTFLSEMRQEAREGQETLALKIDSITETLHKHDKRIAVVENMRRILVGFIVSAGLALLGFLADMAVNHFSR